MLFAEKLVLVVIVEIEIEGLCVRCNWIYYKPHVMSQYLYLFLLNLSLLYFYQWIRFPCIRFHFRIAVRYMVYYLMPNQDCCWKVPNLKDYGIVEFWPITGFESYG